MVIQLKNDDFTVTFKELGGEITSIKDSNGLEYLWQGDKQFWGGQSPVLFPICGSVKDDTTIYPDGTVGKLPRHGLVRKNIFKLEEIDETLLAFSYDWNEDTIINFPYKFELRILYKLTGKSLSVTYQVSNQSNVEMPYCIGGHPGFNCPLFDDEEFSDYYLEFEKEETCSVPKQYPKLGLIDRLDRTNILNGQSILPLNHQMFLNDAITFDDLKSDKVYLKSKNHNKAILVDYTGFPNLVIWSSINNGPFIAIEPWYGLSNSLDDSDNFVDKQNIRFVAPGHVETTSFSITVI